MPSTDNASGGIDAKGRCCGRKPLAYKREPHLFCCRCDRAYDPETKAQIPNWAWAKDGDAFVRNARYKAADARPDSPRAEANE